MSGCAGRNRPGDHVTRCREEAIAGGIPSSGEPGLQGVRVPGLAPENLLGVASRCVGRSRPQEH